MSFGVQQRRAGMAMVTCVDNCKVMLLLCIFNHVCSSDDEGSKLVCKSQARRSIGSPITERDM